MRIINRYLIKQLFAPVMLCVGAMSLLFLSSIIFELGAYLIVRKVHPYLVLLLTLYKLPAVLTMALPIGTFFGVLLTIGKLSKDKEIMVLQMVGISPLRLLIPYLIIALGVSGISFFINEFVVTKANSKAELVIRRIIFDSPPQELMQNVFFRDKERYYFIGKINPNSKEFQNVLIFELNNNKINNLTVAQTGVKQNQIWTLNNGQNYEFDNNGHLKKESAYSSMTIKTQERDQSLLQVEKTAQDMNRDELAGYINELNSQSIQTTSYQVDYHLKAAGPLAAFIFVFVGAPLVIRVRAKEKMYAAGICMGIVLIYYVISSAAAAAGRAQILTPVWGAWLPAVFFLLTGSVIFWWVNNE